MLKKKNLLSAYVVECFYCKHLVNISQKSTYSRLMSSFLGNAEKNIVTSGVSCDVILDPLEIKFL